ncbi:hypothetical protein IAT38_008113 [Cryptococcus sp. DSM 104549]
MSYASVASHNIPFGEMPQPDPNLAEGPTKAEALVEGDLAGANDPTKPTTVELNPPTPPEPSTSDSAPKPLDPPPKSEVRIPQSGAEWEKKQKEAADAVKAKANQAEKKGKEIGDKAEKKGKEISKKARDEIEKAESALAPYWDKTKDVVLRPGTLGGLIGVVNVGILGTIGYFAYTKKDQRWDPKIVGGAVAGTLALFGAEGYVAESYLETPEGKQEAQRAKEEGSKLYLHAKEVILRPQVAGGLVGALNVAILGAVGYVSYKHWNERWDQRTVSAVAVGLLGLSGLEGYAGKVYQEKH